MGFRSVILSCVTLSIFDRLCPHSSIDAKKTALQAESRTRNTTSTTWREDKDLFGNEATLSISEDDIQAALTENRFRAPLNSSVRLAVGLPRRSGKTSHQLIHSHRVNYPDNQSGVKAPAQRLRSFSPAALFFAGRLSLWKINWPR